MSTPPDGAPPKMQMYLFHQPFTTFPDEDPFIASNGGDEADIVYHEYTPGLSNRLRLGADRASPRGGTPARPMGAGSVHLHPAHLPLHESPVKDPRRPAARSVATQ